MHRGRRGGRSEEEEGTKEERLDEEGRIDEEV